MKYLTTAMIAEVTEVISSAEQRAIDVLAQLGPTLRKDAQKGVPLTESDLRIPANIPGHKLVSYDKPVIGDFSALVTDIRDSTKHLRIAISADYSLTERVYLETSLVLAAHSRVVSLFGGTTTEFLGDGQLALFEIRSEHEHYDMLSSFKAGWSCLEVTKELINPRLAAYRLPALTIGVGIARSRAIVSAVGDPAVGLQPNAFGECVFRATKQSGYGHDEVWIDSSIRNNFYTTSTGTLRFSTLEKKNGFESYRVASQ